MRGGGGGGGEDREIIKHKRHKSQVEECKDYRWSPAEQNQRALISHTLRWRGRGGKEEESDRQEVSERAQEMGMVKQEKETGGRDWDWSHGIKEQFRLRSVDHVSMSWQQEAGEHVHPGKKKKPKSFQGKKGVLKA